jgi:hypothetical protein
VLAFLHVAGLASRSSGFAVLNLQLLQILAHGMFVGSGYATTSLRKNQPGFNFSVCGYIYADAAPGDRCLHGDLRQTRHLLFRPDELTEVAAIEK